MSEFTDEKGQCFMSVDELADVAKMAIHTVRRSLQSLNKTRWLSNRQRTALRTNLYQLLMPEGIQNGQVSSQIGQVPVQNGHLGLTPLETSPDEGLKPDVVQNGQDAIPSISLEDSFVLEKERTTEKTKRKKGIGKESDSDLTEAYVVLAHLNEKAHHKYHMMPEAVINILARLRGGATAADLNLIVDYKVDRWGHDAKMRDYLNNQTLFALVHYATYLEEATTWKERKDVVSDPFHMESFVPPSEMDAFKVEPSDLKSGIEKRKDKEKMLEETQIALDALKAKFDF
jgi:uncharacterized phage protein (TIGR02220 family)